MRILIACGGSGGHIFPGIALAQELVKRDKINEILIVCSEKPLDIEILKHGGFNFKPMPYSPLFLSTNPLKIFSFFVRLAVGVFLSIKLLLKFRPHCVAGFGGFVSGPLILAAWVLRIPRLIHEQNFIAGAANRIGSLFADRIVVSFEETKKFFNKNKVMKIGNPVRGNFLVLDKGHSREGLGLDRDRSTLFVTGGSQGARFLNDIVRGALGIMDYGQKKTLQVIHITGRADYESIKDGYVKANIKSRVFSFLDRIERAYAAADLVISRAGATTIAELTYFGKPSILIPYPKRDVYQLENANFLSSNDAAIAIEEKEIDTEQMRDLISGLLSDACRLEEMSKNSKRLGNPDASRLLAEEVFSLSNVKE